MPDEPEEDPTTTERWRFLPKQLDRTVLAVPLLDSLDKETAETREPHAVVMELNLEHPKPRDETRELAREIVRDAIQDKDNEKLKPSTSAQYIYAELWGDTLRAIVARNEDENRPIYRIWPDFEIRAL